MVDQRLFILDEGMNCVGLLDNSLPNVCPFWDDIHTEQLEKGVLTFEFTIPAGHPTASYIVSEAFIVYPNMDYRFQLFRIKEVVETNRGGEYVKNVFCENAAVSELLGSIVRPRTLPSSTIEQAMSEVLQGTDWSLGIVEYAGTRDFEFKDYMTALAAVHEILAAYGAEIEFEVEFIDSRIIRKTINVLQQRGEETEKIFSYGLDLIGVERTEDSSELVTALIGVGKTDPNGFSLTFEDYFPNIDEETYEKTDDWVGSIEALQRWSRTGRHIFGVYKDDTSTNEAELFNNTLEQLKKQSKPKLTYKVDVLLLEKLTGYSAHRVRLGDTIVVRDDTFKPSLVLSARIMEVKRSKTDPTSDSVVLGDFNPISIVPIQTIQRFQNTLHQSENRWNIIKDWAGVDYSSSSVVMKQKTFLVDENQETIGEMNGENKQISFDVIRAGTIISPSIIGYNGTDKDLYVDFVNGNDEAPVNDSTTPWRSIYKCLQDIQYNNGTIRIHFLSDGTEIVNLTGIDGSGSVEFLFQGYTLNGQFNIEACSNTIKIFGGVLNFASSDNFAVIKGSRCPSITVEQMKIFGRNQADAAISFSDFTYGLVKNTHMQECITHLLIAQYGGTGVVENNTGHSAPFSYFAWMGGTIAGHGTHPNTIIKGDTGGEIRGTFNQPTAGTGGTAPPAPDTIATFPVLQGRSYRSGGVTGWRSEKMVYQGQWGDFGLHRGLWLFGNNPSSTVTNKNIKRIRFYCTRMSQGGNSGAVTFYFRWHSYLDSNGLPSGAPTLSNDVVTSPFSWGQGKWIDLSTPEFIAAFKNGTAKGLGLYINSSSSGYYGYFDSPGTLEITYN
ncbi:phage tail spike protein [Risungbinella massiliensis]|uniref:phage tail spike protein n=1 Tax=Risungbinella massiliensis TaxID=1329796 RepID=UPI0005CC471A|nr:phage tail spike protein [Risungbinella massiliensis]